MSEKRVYTMAEKRASDLLVSEDKRIEIMNLVKDGRLSVDKAMERIDKLEFKLKSDLDREAKEREQLLSRMTPKALKQELDKQKRVKTEEESQALEAKKRMSIRANAYVTAPNATDDITASDMLMTDAERVEVMMLVKEGTLSVDDAMNKVMNKEMAIKTNHLQSVSQGTFKRQHNSIIRTVSQQSATSDTSANANENGVIPEENENKKTVVFDSNPPTVLETWAPEEYDRSHPDGYDPEVARVEWIEEELEERERQLADRWAVLEVDLPDSKMCEERLVYMTNKKIVAEMEAAADKAKKERRARERHRSSMRHIKRDQNEIHELDEPPRKMSKDKGIALLQIQMLDLEANIAGVNGCLATLERQQAFRLEQEHLAVKYASLSKYTSSDDIRESMLLADMHEEHADDDDTDDIEAEMARIREEARSRSLSNPLVAVELAAAVMADGVVVDQDKNSEDGADDNVVVAGDGETDDEALNDHHDDDGDDDDEEEDNGLSAEEELQLEMAKIRQEAKASAFLKLNSSTSTESIETKLDGQTSEL
eukprot:m.27540 g.27540  ORF g.27540 m.27540 type:complete len:540 (+) comp15766_c0_seq1:290-1909(+)